MGRTSSVLAVLALAWACSESAKPEQTAERLG